MSNVDFAAMMAAARERAVVEVVPVEGLGDVTVRALTRAESLAVGKAEGDPTATETKMLEFGMVEPALTHAQIVEWLKVAPNDHIDPITKAIARLSGMLKEAPKEAYKSTRGRARR